ncbi:MAG: protein-glutamate O-methyltransferase CheR [Clostridium sp.]|nr:protein-glutamate O-methyltransferase CheR [Clostridium sp.]
MTDYEVFKKQILELTGIDLNAYKERQMKRRITTLSLKFGFQTYEEFYQDLKKNAERRKQFLNYLTINVSEFYRNPMQWQTLEEKVIPDLIEENKGELRIWSAACSTGDEPYTIIMMMKEKFPKVPVKLLATDLDDEVLAFAKQGLYPQKSLTNLPEKYVQKYFREVKPGYYQIAESIMKEVEFRQHNLLADPYGKNYDLIVCRNVLIYFTEEAKIEVFKEFHKSLRKDGYLFIGSTEQILQARSIHFEPEYSFFYKKEEIR